MATLVRKNATLAVDASGETLSSVAGGIPQGCECALIQADTTNIRYRQDGVAPTNATGLRLINNLAPTLIVGQLANVKFIAESGSGNVNIMFQTEQSA